MRRFWFWFSLLNFSDNFFKLRTWTFLRFNCCSSLFFRWFSILKIVLAGFCVHNILIDHIGKTFCFRERVGSFWGWTIEDVIDVAAIGMLVTHILFYSNKLYSNLLHFLFIVFNPLLSYNHSNKHELVSHQNSQN